MKLKCIGGLSDGEIIDDANARYVGDTVRVPLKRYYNIVNFLEELSKIPENISNPYAFYRVEEFNFKNPDYRLTFLIPINWTLPEAIKHLLASHHGI